MNKEIICTVCPRGCHITADVEGKNVQNVLGNFCKRGYTYALNEFVSPVRILTTLVKIDGKYYVHGRAWRKHVEDCYDDIKTECNKFLKKSVR